MIIVWIDPVNDLLIYSKIDQRGRSLKHLKNDVLKIIAKSTWLADFKNSFNEMRDARSGRRGADRVGRCGWKIGRRKFTGKKRRMTSSLCGSLRQGPGEISMRERPQILPTDTDIHHHLNTFLWQFKTKSNCTRWLEQIPRYWKLKLWIRGGASCTTRVTW